MIAIRNVCINILVLCIYSLKVSNPQTVNEAVPVQPLPGSDLKTAAEINEETNNCQQQFANASGPQAAPPDLNLTTDDIILKNGYPVNTLEVTTKDGYILKVFRIPFSPKSPLEAGKKKKAVYLNHGLMENSRFWLVLGQEKNLPMKLADAGFDVFLSNCRGNSVSTKHTSKSSNNTVFPDYWDFSWHEMGIHDVPAVMDLITQTTKQKKMYYIGHSMGTTQYFIALSELPDLNERIHTGFLMAPIAFMSHTATSIKYAAPTTYSAQYLGAPGYGKLESGVSITQRTEATSIGEICSAAAARCGACSNAQYAMFGFNAGQMNYTLLPLMLALFPDQTAFKNIVHYAQSIIHGRFCQFDYGARNYEKYNGKITPPDYDLENIKAPTVFMHAHNDVWGVPQDTEIAASKMRKDALKEIYLVPDAGFNHQDFMYGKDADKLVYNHIISIMVNGTYETKEKKR